MGALEEVSEDRLVCYHKGALLVFCYRQISQMTYQPKLLIKWRILKL